MNLLQALTQLLLALLGLEVTGDCNVYNATQLSRCYQVQDCVHAAFFNDRKNSYVLDKVFRSTEPQPPIALNIYYHVTILEDTNINTNHNSDGSNEENFNVSGSGEVELYGDGGSADESNLTTMEPEVDNTKPIEKISYTEHIGWSTTGIYRAVRPMILVALQPAWYWWTLGFAIDNYSFPNSIHLHLNIANTTGCDYLKNVTQAEVKEALEYFTMNLNYNTTGKTAHLWNTNTDPLRPLEKLLLVIIVSLAISTILLLTGILPKLNHYGSKLDWDSGSLGILFGVLMVIEVGFHFSFILILRDDLYLNIRGILTYTIPLTAVFGGIYGALTSCCYGNSCKRIGTNAVNFGCTYMFAICFAVYALPVLIEASIYPTEIVSTIGFAAIGIASISAGYTILKWFISKGSKKSTSSMRTKFCNSLHMTIISAGIYIAVPFTIYAFLVLYLILLKLRVETPGSQLFQILLAITSTVSAGLGSYIIKRKLKPKEKADSSEESSELNSDDSDDENRKRRQQKRGYRNKQTEQPQDSMNTHERSQPERRQLRKRERVDNQRRERQQSSSLEMQVLIEANPDIETDDDESTM